MNTVELIEKQSEIIEIQSHIICEQQKALMLHEIEVDCDCERLEDLKRSVANAY